MAHIPGGRPVSGIMIRNPEIRFISGDNGAYLVAIGVAWRSESADTKKGGRAEARPPNRRNEKLLGGAGGNRRSGGRPRRFGGRLLPSGAAAGPVDPQPRGPFGPGGRPLPCPPGQQR